MEAREGMSGVTVIRAEAPSAYHVAPRTENPSQIDGSPTVAASSVSVALTGPTEKKKRGRPRKYGPDGTVAMALSPMPISSSAPPSGHSFPGKRGRGKHSGYESRLFKRMGKDNFGELSACSVGANFTPHVITVNAGEDVTMKVISFSQQGPRAICILSANGVISNVTLRQPDSSGGTLTYEGRFEILSLSGSFIPTECQGTRSRSGGMSVSLVSPDGRVVGGGVAGLLVAASPVQVVVGSFLPGNHQEQKLKKQKADSVLATGTPPPSIATISPTSNADNDSMDRNGLQSSSTMKRNLALSHPFGRENWSTMQEPRNSTTDINISLPAS
ncbi:AT-hook motif nuclear-localized protein 1-like [Mangifera indica]|uniref:AT-hook motif nuclear-localized protein 1-like n=1 Tax=Mangifera indica TaxID=29780 RepID=UPI001CFBD769|nr:AT-hook motif nuclear-localized protein 1-like [Mangifera indica]XP_044501466.1 AT-hook motif nuclear-localized protein 1-like [Mangifera indica]XP_044501467.1 AT-hook motif nuclear-localized protein 1-like [Mangifera indica]